MFSISAGALLIAGGYYKPHKGKQLIISEVEMINLKKEKADQCKTPEEYPTKITSPFGGLVNTETPIVCGGVHRGSQIEKVCYGYISKRWQKVATMSTARFGAASIDHHGKLWFTGGASGGETTNHISVKTTEFISPNNKSKRGPDLPVEMVKHCLAKVGKNMAALSGGKHERSKSGSQRTWLYNFDATPKEAWRKKADMETKRYGHACGVFRDLNNGRLIYVVAGGEIGKWKYTKLVEVMEVRRKARLYLGTVHLSNNDMAKTLVMSKLKFLISKISNLFAKCCIKATERKDNLLNNQFKCIKTVKRQRQVFGHYRVIAMPYPFR